MKNADFSPPNATSKTSKTILKLSTLSLSMLCLTMAHAAEAESPSEEKAAKVVKVAVTGSSIKGVAAQSASPITIVKVDEILKQGVTTTEEALSKITANQSGLNTSQSIGFSGTAGATANLRGIGANKTLILLNGRRLAANAFDSGVTNLNIIPLAMLERIEIVRDGASAIYGTDAIGGVINFITKKQFTGLNLSAGLTQPEESGGDTQNISVFGGYGDLDEDRFNIFGVIDYRRGSEIWAKDRKVSKRGGVIPELGLESRSIGAFPANFVDPGNKDASGNPYAKTGCLGYANTTAVGNNCRLNTQSSIGITPKTEDISALGHITFKLSDNLNAIGEYIYSRNQVNTSVAPDVFVDTVTINDQSKYFPGNGIVPAVDGLSGQPLELRIRSQAGNREKKSQYESHRLFTGIEGDVAGWDLNTGVTYARSNSNESLQSGFINKDQLQTVLDKGILNPFGPQAVGDDPNIWNTLNVKGKYLDATLDSTIFDFTLSRAIYSLPAGDVGFAFGGSYRYDNWKYKVDRNIAAQAPSTGVDAEKPNDSGDRNISSVFTELNIPLHKTLEAQLAARYDNYSDVGSTFNPKFALRWEPIKQLMLRSSYSTGFRAPTLAELNTGNALTNSPINDDPILCPGGKPLPGKGDATRDCGQQFYQQNGGNKNLEPEKSTSITAGFVLEPIKNLVFSVDYYNIEVKNQISALSPDSIFADPTKYADKFVRKANGSIDYVIATNQNMGNIKTQGFDIGLNYLTPQTSTGRFGFGIDGTYVTKFDYQTEKNGEWFSNLGAFKDNSPPVVGGAAGGPTIRWKHVANLNWSYENWALNFQQQFTQGYKDQNSANIKEGFRNHRVSDYSVYNISGTYRGLKNTELSFGIKNIFDEEPAASNSLALFQYGYDPRYSDPTGRTYFVRGTYKF
ncbi:TonB-dependent receptor [Acinetobacter gyllenbergii]|uniref:TonB-dependent receptor n=1 Tax=Acinetobacter gyllenbergii TaxID=134534 RepID=UPI000806CF48|nr:TonB-dependent receptor [Acinetobacter gyllenbergii]OBY73615.1 TonB-dependent receptor [Acinetobacter gyllenbergii]